MDLRWSQLVKNKSKCIDRVQFQTPRAPVRLSPCVKIRDSLQLSIDEYHFPHQFRECIEFIRESVIRCIPELETKTFYSPFSRVLAFETTLFFDDHGELIDKPMEKTGRHDASLLVQIDGVWTSEMSWGLRLRVHQVKLYPCTTPSVDENPPTGRPSIFINGKPMFLSDSE